MHSPLSADATLLAGIRVTGDTPHIGTFYGWIRPLRNFAEQMNVVVLIADLQSLDVHRGKTNIITETENLARALSSLLPKNVAIVRESDSKQVANLGILISSVVCQSEMNRVGPLRKQSRQNDSIPLSSLMYPSLMTAGLLMFEATHMLSKPEGTFQHRDVVNDILRRTHRTFGWPLRSIKAVDKPHVNIPSLTGNGPMKRVSGMGCLSVEAETADDVLSQLNLAPRPNSKTSDRIEHCNVISQIWSNVITNENSHWQKSCSDTSYPCNKCVLELSKHIFHDLSLNRDTKPFKYNLSITDNADHVAQNLIGNSVIL